MKSAMNAFQVLFVIVILMMISMIYIRQNNVCVVDKRKIYVEGFKPPIPSQREWNKFCDYTYDPDVTDIKTRRQNDMCKLSRF